MARVGKEEEKAEREEFNKKIGENIRNAYRGEGYSQKEFAEMLNVAPITLQTWVQGKYTVDIFYLIKICKILKIKINKIVNEDCTNQFSDEEVEILKKIIEREKNI